MTKQIIHWPSGNGWWIFTNSIFPYLNHFDSKIDPNLHQLSTKITSISKMVSRPIIVLYLLLASGHGAASAGTSSSSPRQLRASSQAGVSASTSSEDSIPDITTKRSLQYDTTTVQITLDCLNLLAATANEDGKLGKENYFFFTDGMSNGYYSFNDMSSYSYLPMTNKLGFVTLACQCRALGGSDDCCVGDRAALDVSGIDDPGSMPKEMQVFLGDICSTTSRSIGDNKLPPTGELPTLEKHGRE